jgi:hypothetical protein|tara:strand:- start:1350 stop:1607 length:258 start_codon:yes stop_codon:yes gene_type:complete
MKTKKRLNNDQALRKAHKDVQSLGILASTILTMELTQLVEFRLKQIQAFEDDLNLDTQLNPFVSNEAVKNVLLTYYNTINQQTKD